MNNLYANKLYKDKDFIYKIYNNLDENELKNYYNKLLENNIKTAKIVEISQKNDENTIIKQKLVRNLTLEEFVFFDSIKQNKLSKKSINLFKKFIKMYFKKIYNLSEIAVDCKLGNFMVSGLTLVDIVPALFYSEYNQNENSIKYVCFNKDLQIKSILVYWLKYYIKYSYSKCENPLDILKKDFNKLKYIIEKYYKLKEEKEQNDIEKMYSKRFEMLNNLSKYNNYFDFTNDFFTNGFNVVSKLNLNEEKKEENIYVLGGTGAGKTYATSLINKLTDYFVINLDNIYWKDNFLTQNSVQEIKDTLSKIMQENSKFIVEGSYLDDWIYDAFDRCDKIFILKVDYKLQRKRVLLRFIKRKLKIEKCDYKESLKSIKSLLSWLKGYSKNLDEFVEKSKEKYGDKMIILDNSNDLIKNILMK
ncbi:MAG: hypothetical protein IJX17_01970 [Clostridia bacterium]|nr:hypothetical protein [Clostridia bacterium]